MFNLENKTYVIMGIANKRSIGFGVAKVLDQLGAKLVFTYRKERSRKELEKLVDQLNQKEHHIFQIDVQNDEDVINGFSKIGDEVGHIDGVYHSIAFANMEDLRGRFTETSRDGFLLAQDISSYSLTIVAREAKKLMPEGGSIVATTYLGGEFAVQNYNVMGVAKASLEANVRYLALDLGEENIRVNAISAGPIRTLSAKGVGGFNTILKEIEERAPLKRNVDQEEVGKTAAYLLSDLSSGVTGENIHVDSGFHCIK
ncbi:enoyl-ACP reductase FabI [Staphylococcus gallinarum]|jgi:enoyl-[acyl-carrier protein] reductase I|uniref:Enoyl-[acyl-carrier-protein] reductase [NADPH] n=1 Tax=Staphylococcus gallinarum TaxID=1293 RepID=A0A2T4SV62_STAGA|nr:enoyl-ACP reductase FabI [Staphylococcus gallinarum]MCD8821042.1 enoyl-ACP reductase FabI [Staphylococcus gallinarum]MCD8872279.1 enoyl-ACP reductase FabI [Staphylococcus gallinarum]MCW0984513.1 enoyl-ACP reductase FabI [Staphylococcus gallinarum]PTL08761.1 enoyl-[acyl-carrier-protein] reductase FabI [Staphylococcus gallinarum]PTL10088.1 enoyl-[acyl-carrier-protein] reductase FabI [Staphylococcus gallinarum]